MTKDIIHILICENKDHRIFWQEWPACLLSFTLGKREDIFLVVLVLFIAEREMLFQISNSEDAWCPVAFCFGKLYVPARGYPWGLSALSTWALHPGWASTIVLRREGWGLQDKQVQKAPLQPPAITSSFLPPAKVPIVQGDKEGRVCLGCPCPALFLCSPSAGQTVQSGQALSASLLVQGKGCTTWKNACLLISQLNFNWSPDFSPQMIQLCQCAATNANIPPWWKEEDGAYPKQKFWWQWR